MRHTPDVLEQISQRVDIVQLVGRRVKLVRKGRVMWGCCPFHSEKSPSFKVDNERRTYKCFGCGAGGDCFKWLMETEGLAFPEAVERLAEEAGYELPKSSPAEDARQQKKKGMLDIVGAGCEFFEEQLRAKDAAKARDYLRSRGLNGDAARRFRIGYAPAGNVALLEHLKTKNVMVDDMIAAGLVRAAQDDRSPRDFFFNRIMFPITDARSRVVAFGGRALEPDAKPKYINTADTPLFSKGHLLYNFAMARPAALKAQSVIVAEGYMDVIALALAGFEHAVAPLGTSLTEEQLKALWSIAPEPTMAFDGDEAGLRAAHRAARLALPHIRGGVSLRFAFLPAGDDPDSLLRSKGPDAMREALKQALPLSQVLWRGETDGRDLDTPERRAGLEKALAEVVSAITDPKVADYYRRDFDQRVFDAFKRRPAAAPPAPGQAADGRRKSWERNAAPAISDAGKVKMRTMSGNEAVFKAKELEIGRLLLRVPQVAQTHGEELADVPLSIRCVVDIRQALLNLAADGETIEAATIRQTLKARGLDDALTVLSIGASSWSLKSADQDELESCFLQAAADLRGMVELEAQRPK